MKSVRINSGINEMGTFALNEEQNKVVNNCNGDPEAKINALLGSLPMEDSLRFAMAVPQVAALLKKMTISSGGVKYSTVKDEVLLIIAAEQDKSIYGGVDINSFGEIISEVEQQAARHDLSPDNEGLLAGSVIMALNEHGADERLNILSDLCQDPAYMAMIVYKLRSELDKIKSVCEQGFAMAFVVLVSEKRDGVLAFPVVYARNFPQGD